MASRTSPMLEAARVFVRHAPLSMVLLDLETRILEVSDRLLRDTGLPRDEFCGRFAEEAFGLFGGDVAGELKSTRAALDAGEHVTFDRPTQLPAGESMHVRCQVSYWRDERGEPAGLLYINHDVTQEVRAKAEQKRSESLLRTIIDHMPALITTQDLATGRYILVNDRMAELTGIPEGRFVGRRPAEILPAKTARTAEIDTAAARANGGQMEFERVVARGPATGRIIRTRRVVFEDGDHRPYALTVGEDVTELRRATEAMKQAAARADAANQAKSEFLANMSHEIRTPLNGVIGVAGALARTTLAPAQQEMVSIIETSAKTLEALLSDILDLSRVEAGHLVFNPEPFDLATSVTACSALFDAAAEAKGLDLVTSISENALGAYIGDAARLRQILSNLVGNAVKFTARGSVTLDVTAQRGEVSSQLYFKVRDTGIGFDAETKARLFPRFEQADGSITRRFGGTGLGLAISHALAEAMGGRLEADAQPGLGAIFTLTLELPRCAGSADLWGEAEDATGELGPLNGARVLVAEDHPTNRRVLELVLGAAGVELVCVENGAEAVAAFRRDAFDIILMDMQMPVMDGLTAISEIRRLEALDGLEPTLTFVLTANALPEHVRAAGEAGADGHISKPIVAGALLETLAQAIEAQRASAASVANSPPRARA